MTRPATGASFAAAGYNDVDNRFQSHRTGTIAVLFRDALGAETNISPHNEDGTVGFTPLAQDGQLRGDLFAFTRSSGLWVPNPDANEGWHLAGAFAEGSGPQARPSIDTEEQRIEQSNWPFDSEIVEEDEPFEFTPIETAKPSVRRLRNNLPLSRPDGTALTENPGGVDAGWSKTIDPSAPDRQFLVVSARKRSGGVFLEVDGYAACRLSNIGDSRRGKRGEAPALTFRPLPDPFFMAMVDDEYVPILKHTWVGGDAWTALGGTSAFSVALGGATAGTFTLTFRGRTTAGIAFDATAAAVKSALVALDGFTAADWTVTGSAGGPYAVTTPGGGAFPVTPVNS